MSDPQAFLAATSLRPGRGGISRVARLIARALDTSPTTQGVTAGGVVLDDSPPRDVRFPVACANGSQLRFFSRVHAAAFRNTHFIYDFPGTARAHCRIPFLNHPFLTYIHGVEIWDQGRRDRVESARRATLLLSNSHYTLRRAQEIHGGFERARVCWLATESDEPPATKVVESSPPRVLLCGRVADAYKGHTRLIETWSQIRAAVPDAQLVIAGAGTESLAPVVARTRCAETIQLRGFVSEGELDELYASATVFALPSRGEGFGLVYIEAMRHGLPVIASIHDAAPEINVDGHTGYNVSLDRRDELGERLIQLLRDRDHARALGENGRRRWHQQFRFSAFRQRLEPLLNEFLKS
jgi:phosphatidylinositol alpha-1,6-mannosyltransferase